jgi:hypothetical protein
MVLAKYNSDAERIKLRQCKNTGRKIKGSEGRLLTNRPCDIKQQAVPGHSQLQTIRYLPEASLMASIP